MRGLSWLAEDLLASQEGLCSVELTCVLKTIKCLLTILLLCSCLFLNTCRSTYACLPCSISKKRDISVCCPLLASVSTWWSNFVAAKLCILFVIVCRWPSIAALYSVCDSTQVTQYCCFVFCLWEYAVDPVLLLCILFVIVHRWPSIPALSQRFVNRCIWKSRW
jgi:hypothetical protein